MNAPCRTIFHSQLKAYLSRVTLSSSSLADKALSRRLTHGDVKTNCFDVGEVAQMLSHLPYE